MSRTTRMAKVLEATMTLSIAGAALGLLSCRNDDMVGPAAPAAPADGTVAVGGYHLTLLEGSGGLSGSGINGVGKIAGTRGSCPSACYPFIWTPTAGFRNLDGFTAAGFAVDINNSAQVLVVTQSGGEAHSFVWGRLSDIRSLPSMGRPLEQGAVMNKYGDVAGHGANLYGGSIRPAFWPAAGGVVDIVPPRWQGSGAAMGLNNKGQVVGVLGITLSTPLTGFPSPCGCGFIWDKVNGLRRIPISSRHVSLAAINDAGQIVGSFRRDGAYHAFRWHPQTGVIELGGLGGNSASPYAINNLGVVVGTSLVNGSFHPFVWDEQRGMIDLGLPEGASYGSAYDINLDGVITGQILFPGGSALAIWTPS